MVIWNIRLEIYLYIPIPLEFFRGAAKNTPVFR